jgi:chromosome segregation ATPase
LEKIKTGDKRAEDDLSRTLAAIEDRNRKLATYAEALASATAELEGFRVAISKEAKHRQKSQDALAQLAKERLKMDHRLDAALNAVRQLVGECTEQTRKMEALGRTIELDYGWGAHRYAALLESLSTNIVSETEAWLACFLGRPKGRKAYIVCDQSLSLPENLSHSGLYGFGEMVYLEQQEAAELLREDRRQIVRSQFGREMQLIPPSVMAVADFEKIKAEAAEKNCSVELILTTRHQKRVIESKSYKSGPPVITPLLQPTGMTRPAERLESAEEE